MRAKAELRTAVVLVYLATVTIVACSGAQGTGESSYPTASAEVAPTDDQVVTREMVEQEEALDPAIGASDVDRGAAPTGVAATEAPITLSAPEVAQPDQPAPPPAPVMAVAAGQPTAGTDRRERRSRIPRVRASRPPADRRSPAPSRPAPTKRPAVRVSAEPPRAASPVQIAAQGPTKQPPTVQPSTSTPQAEDGEAPPRLDLFREAGEDNLATFSLDVDTASYTITRRELRAGSLPTPGNVRIEEFVNFFDYGERAPTPTDGAPFAVHLDSAPSAFGQNLHLLRVGVQAVEIPAAQRPAANLVFLIDVSGSMNSPDKLPLVQFAMTTLVNTLRPDDTIGIVVYAGREAILLEPTAVSNRGRLLEAIGNLRAGGSTNGEGGLRAAYDLVQQHFRQGGINRVVLCTDGDFNVGLRGRALIRIIERFRRRQITLTALGFGRGSNDSFMEQLADRGNGSYAFVDSRNEALRVLGRDLSATLQVVAADVKLQVAMNPEVVSRFRLIGYENRTLRHRDFDNDSIDAAEVGSGQFVTAYIEYELREGVTPPTDTRELANVRVRWKRPGESQSIERRHAIAVRQVRPSFDDASAVFRFGAAVAEFAEILGRREHSTGAQFGEVLRIARASTWNQTEDAQEFLTLVERARSIWPRQ